MLEICDFVTIQPGFNDNPSRCFKLPFIACEALTSEVFAVTSHLFLESEAETKAITKLSKKLSFNRPFD